MKHLVSGDPEFVARWHKICDEYEVEEKQWISQLRKQGFKAAHPNDGWVDRKNNKLHLAYPQFNDGAKVGDKVMLGWPTDKPEKLRPVRLTKACSQFLVQWFTFEDIG